MGNKIGKTRERYYIFGFDRYKKFRIKNDIRIE